MATKAQLITFIIETFTEADGTAIAKSKLDGYKKADLEEFILQKGANQLLKEWLSTN